jgi:putative membrane protein
MRTGVGDVPHDHGMSDDDGPDPLIDSKLANDRTFLAWFRTGVSLLGLGFVIAKIALVVEPGAGGASDQALYTAIGVLTVLSGAALVVVGYFQHARVSQYLNAEPETRPPRWTRTITEVSAVGSLLLSALIIVTT